MINMTSLICTLTAAVAGFVCTLLARSIAWRLGITNAPNPIVAQHRQTIAYLGGVAIAVAVCVMLALYAMLIDIDAFQEHDKAILLVAPAIGFLLLGLIDDLKPFRPTTKLAWQLLISIYAVSTGIYVPLTDFLVLDMALSLLWIVMLVNAYNVTDVCDGLVTGLTIISLFLIAVLEPSLQMVCFVVAGACVGFLLLNAPPASIFLGDAGSHLLGFLVAGSILLVFAKPEPVLPIYAAPLLVAVPLFELVFISVMRMQQGLPFWKGSPDHFALRLQAHGLSRWQTDLLAWTLAVGIGLLAISMTNYSVSGRLVMVSVALLFCLACWRVLTFLHVDEAKMKKKELVDE